MIKDMMRLFRKYQENASCVLSMNERNLSYIYPNNDRVDFPYADNKLMTKEMLVGSGVVMPVTLATYSSFYELQTLELDISYYEEFVIKPAKGSGGGGILVFTHKKDNFWVTPSGKNVSFGEIKKHIADIIFGVYSFGLNDEAIIEQRISQHVEIERLSPFGLADIRLILFKDKPVLCMARIPTLASDGKANLHQGAIGLGIDMKSGLSRCAIHLDKEITHHPDTGKALICQTIPFWSEAVEMARTAAYKSPLKYLGVDISISTVGPVLLEINVRPGLQIQNANQKGMKSILDIADGKSEV